MDILYLSLIHVIILKIYLIKCYFMSFYVWSIINILKYHTEKMFDFGSSDASHFHSNSLIRYMIQDIIIKQPKKSSF
jgi:hypothetical protein